MIDTILFDLDGTLLPMDQDAFTEYYFKLLAGKMAPLGYEPKQLIAAVWDGMKAMVKNDGTCKNEKAFWTRFTQLYGEKALQDQASFESFYENEFAQAKQACGYNQAAAEMIQWLKTQGYRLALATNPIFPAIATYQRIEWAGLKPEDFACVTTYENSCYSKPNPKYYLEVSEKLGVRPEQCLMVGNDADEDLIAEKTGMQVFLLTDCLINRTGKDLSGYAQGGFEKLRAYIKGIE